MTEFKKRKDTGIVVNTSVSTEYQRYKQQKEQVKQRIKSDEQLKSTQQQLNELRQEMEFIKNMVKRIAT